MTSQRTDGCRLPFMRVTSRVVSCLLLAAAFGIAAGLFKGNSTGLRADIGNLSAPWLLVAYLPALLAATPLRGALVGLVSTLVALAGFYATLTIVLAGHLGGGGYAAEFLVESRANRIYFLAGVVTGPIFGALGAWAGARGRSAAGAVAGVLLAGEIAVVALVGSRQVLPPPLYFRWGVDDWLPYVVESAVGVLIVVIAVYRHRRRSAIV
jgi:Family of unknown function (DUF6518)